ncbi:L,D-transpeptidase [Lentilactobacillus sp. Marseille-Q4993]|uniref:L,D-transpeptidase n=1 Tax=Lentilactobacillus sp. Marseille-Q4993 TaxID=3039492 RepID=UPI0024BC9906|nr:L,D-transpeptidase [Lentilactobacillus sp. Marseille-Q4993]
MTTTVATQAKGTKTQKAINWRMPSQSKAYPVWSKMDNPWLYVSTKRQKVYIHDDGKVVYVMYCSTGTKSSPTPKGTYHIQRERGLSFYNATSGEGARYWVSWKGHGIYLFHSVPVNRIGHYLPSEAKYLGRAAHSHGCIRLSVADAKWMYKTVPYGLRIVIR